MDEKQTQSDHDILLTFKAEVTTKLDALHQAVEKGNSDTSTRLTELGANKVEKEEFHQWQMSHAKEINLREEALKKAIADARADAEAAIQKNAVDVKALQISDAKQTKQLTYTAGALFVLGIILSILGPVISALIAKALHIN